jgi:hypothetical protein
MRNIVIIGIVIWLLFLNGLTTVKNLTSGISLGGAPQVLVSGAQRVIQTVQPARPPLVAQAPGVAGGAVVQPTPEVLMVEAPAPTELPTATPTEVVIVPQGIPEAAKMPTSTPLPTFEVRFPSANLQWAVHTVDDKGYPQECVYVYTINKRACLAPGKSFTDESAKWLAGMMEAGNVAGEPIPYDAPTATPIPPGVCTLANATYKTRREVVKDGAPIGSVTQGSCTSQADADAKADQAVQEMLNQ